MTAEDITEEVFLKALDAISSCKGREATFSSWLYRIAHNKVIDNFRRAKQNVTIDMETATSLSDPRQEIEKDFERQELLKVIADLPQNQKQVIILKFLEGLGNREIGQVMGKSEVAVRLLQMRALTALRERLAGRQDTNED